MRPHIVSNSAIEVISNVLAFRKARTARGSSTPYIFAELVTEFPQEEERFREQWAGVADGLGVKRLHNWGNALVHLQSASQKVVCPYPFYELAVKANGDVTVCCVDWKNDLSVGNVNSEWLRDIWEGEKLRGLQRIHLEGKRSILGPCRDCSVPDTCPDSLDSLLSSPSTSAPAPLVTGEFLP